MKYEFGGELYEWVRMDNNDGEANVYEWSTDFSNKDAVFVNHDSDKWTFDKNDLLDSTYVMQNNIIRKHKVYHNNLGAYVNHRGKRYYVLVTLDR